MQFALVLSDKIKSLSVIKMFSEYSFLISNLVLKFIPIIGSASSRSRSNPLVSLISLSFFIIRTKMFIDVPINGAGLKLAVGMSSGWSVVVQSNNGCPSPFYMLRCRHIDLLDTLPLLLVIFQTGHPIYYPQICVLTSFYLALL